MESKQVGVGAASPGQEIDLEAANAQSAIKCATCELVDASETRKSNKNSIKTPLVFYLETPIIQAQYKLISGTNVDVWAECKSPE